jgi:hypothetical protein
MVGHVPNAPSFANGDSDTAHIAKFMFALTMPWEGRLDVARVAETGFRFFDLLGSFRPW